jgi:hypothetical protein
MLNDEIDSSLQPLVDRLRELPESDPRAVKRVLARIRHYDGLPNARRRALRRYFSRQSGWWAAAAVVVLGAGVTLFARAALESNAYESATLVPAVNDGSPTPVVRAADAGEDSLSAERLVARRFTIRSLEARQVSLVGDFNQWNPRQHRLHRDGKTATWYITVELPAGLHKYAFIVNDSVWTTDPSALRTVDRDFGVTSSLVLVQ